MESIQAISQPSTPVVDAVIEPPSPADAISTPTSKAHPALATTKRKFSKLLENLTNSTSKSTTPTQSKNSHETSAKRIRLDARSRLAQGKTTSSVSNTDGDVNSDLLRSKLASETPHPNSSGAVNTTKPNLPNYAPWSHEQFLTRLKTFADPTRWTEKPDIINEAEWAKRGWTCVEKNTVACRGGCEGRVVISLSTDKDFEVDSDMDDIDDFDVETGDKLVNKYVEFMTTAHADTCPWRQSGCRDDIYRIPIAQASIWKPELRDRYKSFVEISTALPPLDRLANCFDLSEIASSIPADVLDVSSPNELNHTALAFSLLGWHGTATTPSHGIATCSACFRRLGLWMYTASHNQSSQGMYVDASEDDFAPDNLDLIASHRAHCPWVNPSSQHMPGSFAGLSAREVLVRVIKNNAIPLSATNDMQRSVPPNSSLGNEPQDLDVDSALGPPVSTSSPASVKSREEIEKQDKARFARLKDLTKSIGLKGKKKVGENVKAGGT